MLFATAVRPSIQQADTAGQPDSFETVANTKIAYGLPKDLKATNDTTTQMVWGPGTFGFSKDELDFWALENCPNLNSKKVGCSGLVRLGSHVFLRVGGG